MNTENTRGGRSVYRITFTIPVDMEAVEETLLLAIFAVSCLHGEAAVRLDAGYAIGTSERVVVIDASTDIGVAVTRVFIGFCTREFGDDVFGVARASGPLPRQPTTSRAEAEAVS